jgi:metal-responsive CopG/Arc/MetJ family transcriptional regulator
MSEDKDTVSLGTRLPREFYIELQQMFKKRGFLNTSDYLRDLIRKDLEEYEKLSVGNQKSKGATT